MTWTTKFNTEFNEMQDHQFLIVKCKYSIWKIANTLQELKHINSLIEDTKVYFDYTPKAIEVLHY